MLTGGAAATKLSWLLLFTHLHNISVLDFVAKEFQSFIPLRLNQMLLMFFAWDHPCNLIRGHSELILRISSSRLASYQSSVQMLQVCFQVQTSNRRIWRPEWLLIKESLTTGQYEGKNAQLLWWRWITCPENTSMKNEATFYQWTKVTLCLMSLAEFPRHGLHPGLRPTQRSQVKTPYLVT